MAYAEKILPHYTYEDYVHWEGRWALHEGHPIAMSPAPLLKHQRICGAIYVDFELALRNKVCKNCKVYLPIDYKIAEDTVYQPDVLIICKEQKKKFIDAAPVLVVEVLSPSTALRDRNSKFGTYQTQGVKYHLLVNSDKEAFELYELKNEEYILCNHNFKTPFNFILEDDYVINVVLDEIWEYI